MNILKCLAVLVLTLSCQRTESNMSTLKEKLLSLFRKEAVSEKTNDSAFVTLYINAPLQPVDRFELEDAFTELIENSDIGFIDGGGTYMEESGGISACDINFVLNDISEESLAKLEAMAREVGVPKGSSLQWGDDKDEKHKRPVGHLEGMAVHINGTELPKEVYENCDINYVIEQMNSLLEGKGRMYGTWEGPENTSLYFYGESYDAMAAAIQGFISEYPLCQKCVVEKMRDEE